MNEIFLDVETQRLNNEVSGGWSNIAGFGLSLAVTWDASFGFRTWLEPDAAALVAELNRYSRVVGYNLLRFDYAVLSAYQADVHTLLQAKTVDMLADLYRRLGFRPPLDSVAQATLGRSKTSNGMEAVQWYRSGQLDKLAAYCKEDVAITRDVFYHGHHHGHVFYLDNGRRTRVLVEW